MPILDRGPKVIVEDVLQDDWDAPRIVDARAWAHDAHFEPARWIHTGWYDDSNPYPQISVTGVREGSGSSTGWNALDPQRGDPVAWMDGQVYVDVWVDEQTGGINPKKYANELAQRAELVVGINYRGTTYDGDRELHRLGTGEKREPNAPEESPVDHRFRLPVFYGYRKNLP